FAPKFSSAPFSFRIHFFATTGNFLYAVLLPRHKLSLPVSCQGSSRLVDMPGAIALPDKDSTLQFISGSPELISRLSLATHKQI
ncbi:TPA: hypothetical protein ACF5V2_004918, partial [Enterobacter kobei]